MKKVNLILNIVLVLAVAALYVLHFTGNSKTENTASTEDSRITAGSGDIVYINLDTLVNQYDMYNDLRTELESKVSEELRGQNAERAPDVLSGREHEK